uniref:Uncharacterized protein n=1 Tax=Favella ehrenbergii TaxID=182087 RepID=A0A7S3I0H1_9SPIT|mmetsp:Transcript_22618/g.27978  ORF Transcript_22618/g.27978 Transcript_22618/m.27978 type:complete len:162 (+) Transcript_22618:33-518(+)|eukprot:CAMPEP_0170468376 /NCGR_PEP_ID=MMETSP0123-20130129/11581_1 /TAXON_ID=182087 /ORGANISM="Favella ehrenbergii, Strain Fehren 1" /LENGTH=161 /DNA_ID=CAMNT_0010734933 /DNA_START=29 /DNA_END=514 /DNA_ORIENTATION=+
MKSTLKGVVRDHRLPRDYRFHFAQPSSSTWSKNLSRYFTVRQMTKQNVSVPLWLCLVIIPAWTIFHSTTNYYLSGRYPQSFQRQRWLYRSGNYGVQTVHNANPDNFFDKRHYCWTTDPNCGLEVGPKRPWLDLKDPKKNLAKLDRDATQSALQQKNGHQGF